MIEISRDSEERKSPSFNLRLKNQNLSDDQLSSKMELSNQSLEMSIMNMPINVQKHPNGMGVMYENRNKVLLIGDI